MKLLAKLADTNQEFAFKSFDEFVHSRYAQHQDSQKLKYAFISGLTFDSIEQFQRVWQEVRVCFIDKNSHARDMAYRMTGKLVGKLWHDKPALGQYLDSLVSMITQPLGDKMSQFREWQNYVIEAMCALFKVGELLRE